MTQKGDIQFFLLSPYITGSCSTVPSGNAVRNTRRTSGPATMSWNGSAMMMFFGILVSQMMSNWLHAPDFTQASRPPYKDITNTIGTTMQQEIVITLRSVLLSGDTK